MYVKLFGKILQSSIWAEDHATVRVWVTMLLLADRDGVVLGSAPGLAVTANCTLAETRLALKMLEEPDIDSGSQEYGGRRIEKVEGGWLLLNHEKYREIRTDAQLKAAARQRRSYHKKKRETSRTSRTDTEAEAPAEAKGKSKALSTTRETGSWIADVMQTIGPDHFEEDRLLWEGRTVFSFWQWRAKKNGARIVFTDDRKSRIRRWLKIYGLSDCLYAVEGAFIHPDHNHQDGRVFHDFEYIFKAKQGAGTIEKLRDAGLQRPRAVKKVLERLEARGWTPNSE